MSTGTGPEVAPGLEIEEGGQLRICPDEDIASPAAITPIRDGIAGIKVFVEGAATLAAPTGLDGNIGPVDEAENGEGHAA